MGKAAGRPKSRQEKQIPFLRRAGLYLGVAFELPGTIFGGMVVGYFLDGYFGSSPWLLITCTALAFIGAFIRLVSWAKFFSQERERDATRSQKNDLAN